MPSVLPHALPIELVVPAHQLAIDAIHAVVADGAGANPLALRQQAAARGLTGVDLSSESRLTDVDMGYVYEAVGAIDADLREVFGAGHGRMIDAYGTDVARACWLPRIAGGSLVGVAVTEPAGGSDLRALATCAERVPGGWKLNGVKGPMARITEAEAFVVFAVTDHGLTAFIVDATNHGIRREMHAVAGLGGWSFGILHFDDALVANDDLLGAPGDGRAIFTAHFAEWRAFMALVAVGAGEAALGQAREWARGRELADGSLATVPAVVEHFGRHKLALDLARGASFAALGAPAAKRPQLAAAAKVAATDAGYAAVDFAITVFGARGLMPTSGLDKRSRDLLALKIADGANAVLTAHLGRSFLQGGA